jgi:DNA-binding response OmpR family regulator
MSSQALKLRILVVDDDDVSRAVLHDHLEAGGHEVLLARDVPEARSVLESAAVQIVIADWIMPGATGLDLCAWVRRQPWGERLHYVMLTVLSEKAKLIEAFRHGVDDFLSKPLDEGELLARLNAWTRIVTLQDQLARRHAEAIRVNEELILGQHKACRPGDPRRVDRPAQPARSGSAATGAMGDFRPVRPTVVLRRPGRGRIQARERRVRTWCR